MQFRCNSDWMGGRGVCHPQGGAGVHNTRLTGHVFPESSRWLLMKVRIEEAKESLRRCIGKDLSLDDPEVLKELSSIEGAIRIERQSIIYFKETLFSRNRSDHVKRLLLGCGGQFMQQFGGINALNCYFRSFSLRTSDSLS